jgi:hypothetical protein
LSRCEDQRNLGFGPAEVVPMPANNLSRVFQR